MRKVVLSLVGVMAALLLTQQATATAVFARQTGMACSSCHFQHFPLLNGFGRAFKSSGYSMVGAQARVEGADLSIPNTLNMSVLATAGYEKSDRAKAAALVATPEKNSGDGLFYVPASGGELSLFFGGRLSENAGFLGELSSGDASGAHSSVKMPLQFDMSSIFSSMQSGMRVAVVPFATDVQGASYSFETLNTGANAVHQMSPVRGFNGAHIGAVSAQQYIGTGGVAKGLSLVVSDPIGFFNVTRYDRTGIAGGAFATMGSTYLRAAGFIPLTGWEAMAVGVQMWSGSSAVSDPAGLVPLVMADTKAYAVDGQLQGYVGDMPLGIYASYAVAPVVSADPATGHLGNAYNTYYTQDALGNPVVVTGTHEKSALNISSELGIVPNVASFGVAVRMGKSGNGLVDNAVLLTGTYHVAQNILLSLAFTSASGSYWYSNDTYTGTTDQIGKTTYTLNLSSVF